MLPCAFYTYLPHAPPALSTAAHTLCLCLFLPHLPASPYLLVPLPRLRYHPTWRCRHSFIAAAPTRAASPVRLRLLPAARTAKNVARQCRLCRLLNHRCCVARRRTTARHSTRQPPTSCRQYLPSYQLLRVPHCAHAVGARNICLVQTPAAAAAYAGLRIDTLLRVAPLWRMGETPWRRVANHLHYYLCSLAAG